MPDIGTISAALSSIQSATEIAKYLKNIDSTFEKAELRLNVAELMEALAESKMNLSDIKELILLKDDRIKQLELIIQQKEELIYQEPFYIKKDDPDIKFCQRCYESENKVIRVQKIKSYKGSHICKVCNTYYGKGRPPQVGITSI